MPYTRFKPAPLRRAMRSITIYARFMVLLWLLLYYLIIKIFQLLRRFSILLATELVHGDIVEVGGT
jgi:hypothetical protein